MINQLTRYYQPILAHHRYIGISMYCMLMCKEIVLQKSVLEKVMPSKKSLFFNCRQTKMLMLNYSANPPDNGFVRPMATI